MKIIAISTLGLVAGFATAAVADIYGPVFVGFPVGVSIALAALIGKRL